MPRPASRPYECIRRSWHSDSHHLLRGALIHEIFRVVHDLHGTTTRRKKEWQEKLPLVVLQAEEILYSRANSEGEYADVETLRSRLNDAVNMMIRREDSEQDGIYLVPCVEAALSLRCPTKKASRAQRPAVSRHLPKTERHIDPAVSMENRMLGATLSYDKCSSFLKTQTLPFQDSTSMSQVFSSIARSCPSQSKCYTCIIPGDNLSSPKPLEVCQSLATLTFPKPGGLVQFLRTADACRLNRFSALEAVNQAFTAVDSGNKESNALHSVDSGKSSGPRMDCGFLHRGVGGFSSASARPSTVSRLTHKVNRTSSTSPDKSRPSSEATAIDSASCIMAQSTAPLPIDMGLTSRVKPHSLVSAIGRVCPVRSVGLPPLMLNSLRNDQTSSFQMSSSAALSNLPASSSQVHDLQLRLGPPGNASATTSAFIVDLSAPKRMKIELLDSSVPSALK